ncbi:MAG TPA: CoB--CoM heterodisulfide reductase iron-sulfur subunit B family protein [Desulfobacteraceae bacterium]|nr:CoB--CoM heterodisulfide reductase iron-sulfur subunit B family protein [Desulfobacteraceae bacterium]HPQ28988.1 CoB--CoM heterodisulfide reductase iron-sulfur subunit B family protein [Desulfobacteraceae bacterium]
MDLTYYPGCSLKSSARHYDQSIRSVCKAIGIDLHELPDWICCGSTSAHTLDEKLALSLSAYNVKQAEKLSNDMLVPCPLCYNRLARAHRASLSDIVIYNISSFMGKNEWLKKIQSRVIKPLSSLKAVCYYGCMANRPPAITRSKEYENPCDMDRIAKALGINVIEWSYKTDCCGASLSISRQDIVNKLVKKLYDKAIEAGAECIIVSCQMCHNNLDLYQHDISEQFGQKYYIPIFYFTELIGLALGLKGTFKWLRSHIVDPVPLLKTKLY